MAGKTLMVHIHEDGEVETQMLDGLFALITGTDDAPLTVVDLYDGADEAELGCICNTTKDAAKVFAEFAAKATKTRKARR